MPRFKSIDGVWKPVNKTAKRELEAQGLTHLGQKVTDDESVKTAAPTVETADLVREHGTKQERRALRRVEHKAGVKPRTIRPKAG